MGKKIDLSLLIELSPPKDDTYDMNKAIRMIPLFVFTNTDVIKNGGKYEQYFT